jgi:hypothetical protein
MALTTYQPQKSSNLPTIAVYVLALLGVGLLVYLGINVLTNLGSLRGKSALSVSVLDGTAEVYLNGNYLGATPYDSDDVKSGENKVRVKNDQTSYDVAISFMPNSEIVLNRDLGVSDVFSSGQNFWIEKADLGTVLSIVSEPAGAKVFVDNTEIGTTPFSTANLSDGEYELRVEKPGFEAQTARIKIQKGFKLNVVMKMFPLPVPMTVSLLEGADNLYDVYSSDSLVTSDAPSWTRAVVYWNRTRGVNLSGAGVNKDLVFDYFIDYTGRVYDKEGNDITGITDMGEVTKGAYLRKVAEGPGLSEAAKTALESLKVVIGRKATIKPTGTGWLNVRSTPGLNGEVLTKVNVGESFGILEEGTNWVKIRVSTDVEGWVSSTYVTIE